MALDAKAIKEEIPDKDTYDINSRRTKGKLDQKIRQVFTFNHFLNLLLVLALKKPKIKL